MPQAICTRLLFAISVQMTTGRVPRYKINPHVFQLWQLYFGVLYTITMTNGVNTIMDPTVFLYCF